MICHALHGKTRGQLTKKAMSRFLKPPARVLLYIFRRIEWRLTSVGVVKFFGELLFRTIGLKRNGKDIQLSKVSTVLVLRLENGIGDVVLFTPFLREIRRNLPSAWITLVVAPYVYNLVELCPYVNEVVTFDWKTPNTNFPTLVRHWRAFRLAATKFWRRRFDLAIIPRRGPDFYHAVFLAYFSGARWRVAYSEQVTQDEPTAKPHFDRLITHPLALDGLKHEVQYNSDVLRAIGLSVKDEAVELWTTKEDECIADDLLAGHGIVRNVPLIALCPGAGVPDKVWPLTAFRELIRWIHQDLGMQTVVVGGPAENLMGEELRVALGSGVINLAGKATLRQTVRLISQCALFVGNDSGPMHLSAAAKVPVVEIICHPRTGDAGHCRSPKRFGPWGIDAIVLQPEHGLAPCNMACLMPTAHCITQIQVEDVKQAVLTLLTKHGRLLPIALKGT